MLKINICRILTTNEIWKDIKGFEGLYQVSNKGRVKSLKYKKERILKPPKHKDGGLTVILHKDGKSNTYKVHRLVAEAFKDNPENKELVHHINSHRDENVDENLKWVTPKEHSKYTKRQKKIAKNNYLFSS